MVYEEEPVHAFFLQALRCPFTLLVGEGSPTKIDLTQKQKHRVPGIQALHRRTFLFFCEAAVEAGRQELAQQLFQAAVGGGSSGPVWRVVGVGWGRLRRGWGHF